MSSALVRFHGLPERCMKAAGQRSTRAARLDRAAPRCCRGDDATRWAKVYVLTKSGTERLLMKITLVRTLTGVPDTRRFFAWPGWLCASTGRSRTFIKFLITL